MELLHFTSNVGEAGYVTIARQLAHYGEQRNKERTGTGTHARFGVTWACNLQEGFPLFSIRKINWRAAIDELLWFIRGEESAKWFQNQGHKYWNDWLRFGHWAGRIYGVQWRDWKAKNSITNGLGTTDQLKNLLDGLQANPEGRRHVVTAWNPGELDQMCLPPCHMIWQVYIRQGEFLDLVMYQRSADIILGVPHDIVIYAALNHMLSNELGLKPGYLKIMFGDTHIYTNHIDHVRNDWPQRHPGSKYSDIKKGYISHHQPIFILDDSQQRKLSKGELPLLRYTPECFAVQDYDPYPSPKLKVSV